MLPGTCLRASFLFLVCCALYSNTDSETSYTWKLVDLAGVGEAKIVADVAMAASTTNSGIMANMVSGLGGVKREDSGKQEQMLDILLSTVTNHDGMWKKTTNENH